MDLFYAYIYRYNVVTIGKNPTYVEWLQPPVDIAWCMCVT